MFELSNGWKTKRNLVTENFSVTTAISIQERPTRPAIPAPYLSERQEITRRSCIPSSGHLRLDPISRNPRNRAPIPSAFSARSLANQRVSSPTTGTWPNTT
jgi:hypothetical protein